MTVNLIKLLENKSQHICENNNLFMLIDRWAEKIDEWNVYLLLVKITS